jgi:Flp pilus assembly protein TadB
MLCGALLAVVEPEAMGTLFTTWYGLAACALVATMQLLGAWFLRRVMRIDV